MTKKTNGLKYKDLIAKSNKDLESERVLLRVEKAKQNIESTITETKGHIIDLKESRQNLLIQENFDFKAYLAIDEEYELYLEGIKKAEQFLADMF